MYYDITVLLHIDDDDGELCFQFAVDNFVCFNCNLCCGYIGKAKKMIGLIALQLNGHFNCDLGGDILLLIL